MMADIEAIFQFLLNTFSGIANLYTGSLLLSGVIALWLLRKIVRYFKSITG